MTAPRRRNSLRLAGYDYRTPGAYFITICTSRREHVLLEPRIREIVGGCWEAIPAHFPHVQLDALVVMPNHVHGILHLLDEQPSATSRASSVSAGSLSAVVRSFKAATTKQIHEFGIVGPVWQRNYYDRILRGQRDLERSREYIANNPANWRYDSENPERDVSAEYLKAWSWIERPEGAATLGPYAGGDRTQPIRQGGIS